MRSSPGRDALVPPRSTAHRQASAHALALPGVLPIHAEPRARQAPSPWEPSGRPELTAAARGATLHRCLTEHADV